MDVKINSFNIRKKTDKYIISFVYICYRKWAKKLQKESKYGCTYW
jgi:hypothetical protein